MITQRFQALKHTLSDAEFNSVEFLTNKAAELKESDPQLSERILVRVKNLKIAKEKNLSFSETNKPSQVLSEKPFKTLDNSVEPKTEITLTTQQKCVRWLRKPFTLFVVLPSLLFAFYQLCWATERFESRAQVIVQQPDASATLDAGMALLSGFGVQSSGSDTELVKAYINSNDMLQYLNKELDLRAHYSDPKIDFFSRIHDGDTQEQLFQYYQDHIEVILDEKSGVVSVYTQGFDSEFAQQVNNKIVKRAEWFINSIGHQLANAQLNFMQTEHKNIEEKFALAQTNLLKFQQRYNLLDPTAEGAAMQQIAYSLEGLIATKQTELKTLRAVMSNNSPQVKTLNNELNALQAQLKNERNKLAESGQEELSVSEILARFTDFKVKMELALQAYTSSQVSLEKSRIEAYRQLKYLIVVEESTLSEESTYPDVFYNISLFLLLLTLVFGIGKIIITTVNELK